MSPLIAVVGGFASGIFARSLYSVGWEIPVFILVLAVIVGAAAFFTPRRAYTLAGVFCLCCALGIGRGALAESPRPSAFQADLRQRVTYTGVVAADPDLRDAQQRVQVRVERGKQTTKILVVTPREPIVHVGDSVSVSGTLLPVYPFETDAGRTFRYDKYLEKDGVRFIMNYAFLRVVEPAPWYSLPGALARLKHAFLDGLAVGLPEPHSSLAGGIVIGGKTGLGGQLQDAFITSGLVHIIVLSGYNVMVVADWVMKLFGATALPRRWQIAAGALALLAFVGVAGASATAIRASLMALIALYARATGRTYLAGRALLVVILLMLAWNPLYLVFDPGFGLSVAATAGLIWLSPIIESWFDPAHHKRIALIRNAAMRNAFATTLAAQVAVLPLLLYGTGTLSLVAIPANLAVALVMPLAMGFSALAGFAGMLLGPLLPAAATALAFPGYLLNSYLFTIAETSAALPSAALTLPPFPFWLVLVAYAALIAAAKRVSATAQLRFAKKASI